MTFKNTQDTFYKKIDFLPQIPNRLIDDIESIKKRGNIFPEKYSHFYSCYQVSPELYWFLQNYFHQRANIRYQLITDKLPIHVDKGELEFRYNYILQAGGNNVATRWWDSLQNPTNILYENIASCFTWHRVTTNIPHDISQVSSYRLSIEVHFPKTEEEIDEVPN